LEKLTVLFLPIFDFADAKVTCILAANINIILRSLIISMPDPDPGRETNADPNHWIQVGTDTITDWNTGTTGHYRYLGNICLPWPP